MTERLKKAAWFIGYILVGYVLAVLVAALTTVFILLLAVVATSNGPGPAGNELLMIAITAIFLTGAFAWPGFTLTLVGACYFEQRSTTYFCICGVLTAGLALALFSGLTGMPNMWYVFFGGAAGGFAYARFHQRFINWPAQSES
ncbi:MAG: hypothetical protein AAFR39_07075 [Pseudomonadota bacterium]